MDRHREGGKYQDGMKLNDAAPEAAGPVASSALKLAAMFRRDSPAEAAFRAEVRTCSRPIFRPRCGAARTVRRPRN